MTTLISPAEAVRYSPVDNDFSTARLYGMIFAEEFTLFRDRIGEEFYAALLADLKGYPGVEEWNGGPYAAGEHAMEAGIVYTSVMADNEEPIGDPLNYEAWREADKFEAPEYNLLWTQGHLRDFLAYAVIIPAVTFSTFPVGAGGATQRIEDSLGVRAITHPNYARVVEEIRRGKELRYGLLISWLALHKAEYQFTGLKSLSEAATVSHNGRRTFYR